MVRREKVHVLQKLVAARYRYRFGRNQQAPLRDMIIRWHKKLFEHIQKCVPSNAWFWWSSIGVVPKRTKKL